MEGYNLGKIFFFCIICDDEIKFKILFDIVDKYNVEYVVMGYYIFVEYLEVFFKYFLKLVYFIIKD